MMPGLAAADDPTNALKITPMIPWIPYIRSIEINLAKHRLNADKTYCRRNIQQKRDAPVYLLLSLGGHAKPEVTPRNKFTRPYPSTLTAFPMIVASLFLRFYTGYSTLHPAHTKKP